MSNKTIHSALRQQFALIPTYPKAYKGIAFSPTEGVLYLREDFVPAETYQVGMEDTSTDRFTGIYQIMVVAPLGRGMAETYTALEDIELYFHRGLFVGDFVRIDKIYTANSIIDGAWMYTPVTIRYTALI